MLKLPESLPELMIYVCFVLWFVSALCVVGYQNIRGVDFSHKFNIKHPFDQLLMFCIGSWLAMWCFRSLC